MKRFILAPLLAIALALPGCAGWQKSVAPVLSDVAATIADAEQVLDIIRAASALFFLAHPAPEAQAKVERAFSDCHLGIDSAIRATKGATELTQEQLDQAWADFQQSYRALSLLLKDLGILGAPSGAFGLGRAGGIPEPLAMRRR